MNKFIIKHILQPLAGKWVKGFIMLLFWTIAFIGLPAISGWFLAICSVAFVTASTFSYLVPSAIIRFFAILRTGTRYFERLENHKATLDAQQLLQLKIFKSVAKLPYFKKQVNNNSKLLENATYGVDQILNHILLWVLPLSTLVLSIIIYSIFLNYFNGVIAIEFLISSAILLFFVPQLIFRKNRILYQRLKLSREDNNQMLIQSFRGRIEISKYGMEESVIGQYNDGFKQIEKLEKKLQTNSFWLQLIAGLGFSYIASFILWSSGGQEIDAPTAIGIFFGILAQAELSEMLFAGRSEKSSVANQIKDLDQTIKQEEPEALVEVQTSLENIKLKSVRATVPETTVETEEISFEINRGEWIALYGETGKGKTTLLNGLFYPEYRKGGTLTWNNKQDLIHLPIPECIYVTQKAYLLTGTLRENFEGYDDDEIEAILKIVDLSGWRESLPDGLSSWLGENGETLSGGQRKKLLLAQALLKKPQLLVVDEPTAGISSENAIQIFQRVRELYPNITILMATHLREFERFVDKIVKI